MNYSSLRFTSCVLSVTALSVLAASGCSDRGESPTAGESSIGGGANRSRTSAATFVERSVAAGLDFRHTDGSSGKYYIVETLASGVGLFDFDGDGDLDIYLLNGRALPPTPAGNTATRNALYENQGDGTFRDVTEKKGVPGVGFSIGCCVGDYDGDGDLDLYVTGFGRNVLYQNGGAAAKHRFTDVTEAAKVEDDRFSAGCAFVDYDRDGDLDLYVSNYCEVDFATSTPCEHGGVQGYCAPAKYRPVHDSVFENRGDGTFADVSVASGVVLEAPEGPGPKWGMGVVTCDFNEDGWPDIYVANDVSDNFLLENQKNGKFRHVAMDLGAALGTSGSEQGSMGVTVGDFDRDGRFDVFVTNYQKQHNALYRHEGVDVGFTDQALGRGLGDSTLPKVSWGTKLVDLDADGWQDLFIANGHLEDQIHRYDDSSEYLQRNQVFVNEKGKFREAGADELGSGFEEKLSSRGAAFGDIDNDGDIDIVVCNSRDRPSLLINQLDQSPSRPKWIRLELRGETDRFAIGAKVTVRSGDQTWIDEVRSGGSYCSQSDLRILVGLGSVDEVDVDVLWPDGRRSSFPKLAAGRTHVLEQ